MNKGKKEHIKKMLNQVGVEKAPVDFTQQVMQDIFVSTSEEGLKDEKLATLLKEPNLEIPSTMFVSNVMKDIEMQRNLEYKPLISKKGWLLIGGFFVGMLVFVFFKDAPQEPSAVLTKLLPYLEEAKNRLDVSYSPKGRFNAPELSPILAISLFCLSSMLIFETILKRRLFT